MVQALLQPLGRGTGAGVISATPAPALGVIAATLAVSSLVRISESPPAARIKIVKQICLSTEERSAASPGGDGFLWVHPFVWGRVYPFSWRRIYPFGCV